MTNLTLNKCEKSLTIDDLNSVENILEVKIPESLKQHYLKFNGGLIKNSFIPGKVGSFIDPWDFDFIPMLYAKEFNNDTAFSMPMRTKTEWGNGEVPAELIPFALYMGEYICIEHQSGKIYYFERLGDTDMPKFHFNTFEEFLTAIEVGESPKPTIIITHPYWGDIFEDCIGFTSSTKFRIPYFEDEEVSILFGNEESEKRPSIKQLDDYEKTFHSFLQNIKFSLESIKENAFEYYQKRNTQLRENSVGSVETTNIDSSEEHFEYIKKISQIRILKDNTIQISIRYTLDIEHGIEFKIKNNQVVRVSGIAEL